MTKHVLVKFHNYRDIQKDSACFRITKTKYMTIFNQKKKKKTPNLYQIALDFLPMKQDYQKNQKWNLLLGQDAKDTDNKRRNILMDFAKT